MARAILTAILAWAWSARSLAGPEPVYFDGPVKVSLTAGDWTYYGGQFSAFGARGPGAYAYEPASASIISVAAKPGELQLPSAGMQVDPELEKKFGLHGNGRYFEAGSSRFAIVVDYGGEDWPAYLLEQKKKKGPWSRKRLARSIEPELFRGFVVAEGGEQAFFARRSSLDALDLRTATLRNITTCPDAELFVEAEGATIVVSIDGDRFYQVDAQKGTLAPYAALSLGQRSMTEFTLQDGGLVAVLHGKKDTEEEDFELVRFERDGSARVPVTLVQARGSIRHLSREQGNLRFVCDGVLAPYSEAHAFVARSSEGAVRFGELFPIGNKTGGMSATSDDPLYDPNVEALLLKKSTLYAGGNFRVSGGMDNFLSFDLNSGQAVPIQGKCEGRVTWIFDAGPRVLFGGDLWEVAPGPQANSADGKDAGYIGILDPGSGKLSAYRGVLNGNDCGRRGYAPWTRNPRKGDHGKVLVDSVRYDGDDGCEGSTDVTVEIP